MSNRCCRRTHPADDRACSAGILFVLKTGIGWEDLPDEMGCGSGMTCWRRLCDWHAAGVFQRLHEALLVELRAAGCVDWGHVVADSVSVRAVFGGRSPAPNPTDRAKAGTKHHVATDAGGVPLAAVVTAANRNDVTQLLPRIDAIPPIRGAAGPPLTRPRWSPTAGTTATRTGGISARRASAGRSRGAGRRTGAAWGFSGGSSSGRGVGCSPAAAGAVRPDGRDP